MKTKDIIQLLERYYRAETTREEEKLLKEYFLKADVPAGLQADKDTFLFLHSQTQRDIPLPQGLEARLSAQIDRWDEEARRPQARRLRLSPAARRWIGIAASLLVIAGTGVFCLRESHPRDTFDSPELAYAETQRALQLFANALQKGQDGIEKAGSTAQEVHEALEKCLPGKNNSPSNH